MKTTKITISPEMREFNEAVQEVDALLDFQFDTKSVEELIQAAIADSHIPHHVEWLKNAMAGLAVKR